VKIGGQLKHAARVDVVAHARAVLAWNAADPATRGAHPDSGRFTNGLTTSPWRKAKAVVPKREWER
jgi:hypothetical protein